MSSSDSNKGAAKPKDGGSDGARSAHAESEDNYFKIKMHAIQCLHTLFKANDKAFNLNTLWHPIFPSFLINPSAELSNPSKILAFMSEDKAREEFKEKALAEIGREPTLFYLIRSSHENGTKFRQAACMAITSLLENSEVISKW